MCVRAQPRALVPQSSSDGIGFLMDEKSGAQDFIKPGHVFPLKAVKGGVLERSYHTEGTVDLARICGLKPQV